MGNCRERQEQVVQQYLRSIFHRQAYQPVGARESRTGARGQAAAPTLPKGHRRSLREIAKELAALGHTNKSGASYSASCVKSMVEGH